MQLCEFCSTAYRPRPQVKNPRACKKCQILRQRANEKEWKKRNAHLSSKKYYQIWRRQRDQRLKQMAELLLKCIHIGKELLGLSLDFQVFQNFFTKLIRELGLRRANKFWIDENYNIYNNLENYLRF